MAFLLPSSVGKSLLEKKIPSWQNSSNMNSCFIQYKAPFEKYVIVTQTRYSLCQDRLILCPVWIILSIFGFYIVSITVHDNKRRVCNSLEVYTLFLLPFYIVCFGQEVSSSTSVFSICGKC